MEVITDAFAVDEFTEGGDLESRGPGAGLWIRPVISGP